MKVLRCKKLNTKLKFSQSDMIFFSTWKTYRVIKNVAHVTFTPLTGIQL